jgi:hypothetical protein
MAKAATKEKVNGEAEAPVTNETNIDEVINNLQKQLIHHQQMTLKITGAIEAFQQIEIKGDKDGD